MNKKRKLSESESESELSESSESIYINLKPGDDIKLHVDSFFESHPRDDATKEWIQNESWKQHFFHIYIEDLRDSQEEEDVVNGVVPGSALTLDQYKILYAIQNECQFNFYDEKNSDSHEMPLEEQVLMWFCDPNKYGLINAKKYFPQCKNITWREDDGSFGSLFQYKKTKLSAIQLAIPIHIAIS